MPCGRLCAFSHQSVRLPSVGESGKLSGRCIISGQRATASGPTCAAIFQHDVPRTLWLALNLFMRTFFSSKKEQMRRTYSVLPPILCPCLDVGCCVGGKRGGRCELHYGKIRVKLIFICLKEKTRLGEMKEGKRENVYKRDGEVLQQASNYTRTDITNSHSAFVLHCPYHTRILLTLSTIDTNQPTSYIRCTVARGIKRGTQRA